MTLNPEINKILDYIINIIESKDKNIELETIDILETNTIDITETNTKDNTETNTIDITETNTIDITETNTKDNTETNTIDITETNTTDNTETEIETSIIDIDNNDLFSEFNQGEEPIRLGQYILDNDDLDNQIMEEIESVKKKSNQPDFISTESSFISIDTDQRIVATLSCQIESINFLEKTLDSIDNNDFDVIYLIVDPKIENLISEKVKLICNIIYCKQSLNINKLYQVLLYETDPYTIIVSLDNGMIYPNNIVKEVKKNFKRFPNSTHAVSMMKFKSINFFEYIVINGNIGDIFESFYLVCYMRHFFKNDFKSYLNLLLKYDYCNYSGDLIISNYLYKYKITIRCINRKKLNKNIIKQLVTKEKIHTSSGLNSKIIYKYYKVIQLLGKYNLLYLRNSNSIIECFNYLMSKPYHIAFCN